MGRNTTQESYENGSNTPAFAAWLIIVGIIVIGGAIYIGLRDSGPIDVSATIQESNQAQPEGSDNQVSSASQTFQNMTNGGLVAREEQNQQTPPVEEVPSTEATSTEAASTTAPSVTDGEESTDAADESTEGVSAPEAQ